MRVNEIFCSLQGEGHFTGTPAVFLRLSGCNLACPFCDTQHESYREMSEEEIVHEVSQWKPRHLVITGGEPSLQLTQTLVDRLHAAGFFIQIETNGTLPLPERIDWVTCSPKAGGQVVLEHVNEVKLLFSGHEMTSKSNLVSNTRLASPDASSALQPENILQTIRADEHRLQPLDTGNAARNAEILEATINYLLEHPTWSLSLQTHKIINVR